MNPTPSLRVSPDEAFYHRRKAYLVYPLIAIPFLAALFYLGQGGKGIPVNPDGGLDPTRGFNANVPNAENAALHRPTVERPTLSRSEGQMLSDFTDTREAPVTSKLRPLPGEADPDASVVSPALPDVGMEPPVRTAVGVTTPRIPAASNPKTIRIRPVTPAPGFEYHSPQIAGTVANPPETALVRRADPLQGRLGAGVSDDRPRSTEKSFGSPASDIPAGATRVQLVDPSAASRLAEPEAQKSSPFHSADVGTIRREGARTTLPMSGQRSVATLIPVVIHEDQRVRPGQPVKLRLTRALVVEGVAVPAHTIVHAVCQPDGDRIRLVVHSLQLSSQLVPLELEAVDLDGGTGVNAPGLSEQLSGQLKSSAVQGITLPAGNPLVNTVLNTARYGASTVVRQPVIHLKGGYNLYLKSL